jgi:large subunit ribosomal protein L9
VLECGPETSIVEENVMAKRIQLVLNENVSKLGRVGDLVEVAPGYARNYLLPKGIAFNATPGVLKLAEKRRAEEAKRQAELKAEAEKQKAVIEKAGTVQIQQKAGEGDTLFGSVTATNIAEAVQQACGIEIDRRAISTPDIRKLGTYSVEIKLYTDVTAKLDIEVIAE